MMLLAMMLLLAAVASCRDEAVDPPTGPRPPGVTVPAPASAMESKSAAANPFGGCDTCHVDVEDEVVGTKHDAEGVGCVKCHGPSEGHIADENNEVLPDRVFARSIIDGFCGECHECSRPAAGRTATAQAKQKVCTDCHGAHDLLNEPQP